MTVNVAFAALSSAIVTSLIARLGVTASSSVIVRMPVGSDMLALVAFNNVKVAVSLPSSILSLNIGTSKVLVTSPGAKVKLPLTPV